MGMVRFAEVCDRCQTRGPEYEAGFTAPCEDCGRDICAQCTGQTIAEMCCGAPDCRRPRREVLCPECTIVRAATEDDAPALPRTMEDFARMLGLGGKP